MKHRALLSSFVVFAFATVALAAGLELQRVHYTRKQLEEGVYLGSEACLACHQDKAGWRGANHALGLRRPIPRYSLIPGKGVVADFDQDGVDDFMQGLDFNQISSVFDPYMPNAPILSVEDDTYYITIGELKMPVIGIQGGTGNFEQRFLLRVPVIDTEDGFSVDNYVSPFQYNEKTHHYELDHPDAWYEEGRQPKFDRTTESSFLAANNSSSHSRSCINCHATGIRDIEKTATGEWKAAPSVAILFPPEDPSYFDYDHNGWFDIVNVQCESCHGPGSAHVLGQGDPAKIVNPGDLDTEEAKAICTNCHSNHTLGDTNHPRLDAAGTGKHSDTQGDVAGELAQERAGQTPDDVVHGEDAENCIACHAPTAVLANGGMNEVQALNYFFTTTNGKFTPDTAADHDSQWPSVTCITCHDQHSSSRFTYFNSSTGEYEAMESAGKLCGQCHGSLRFVDTDHRTYDTWAAGSHADTQMDVAGELAEERVGETADDVLNGDDPEDCIACHAPTAVLANGGMSETQALNYFFTTTDGHFTPDTAADHGSQWPGVSCIACHDQHNASQLAYFNPTTNEHEPMDNAGKLCGQCHGNLRIPGTDHLTFNAWASSRHADTQADVASELAEERGGQTPDEVVRGDDPENCIACHAPTAVLANGGMSESEALNYFFTTTDGKFTADTADKHNSEWPSVTCTACHDQHTPAQPAYFNSSTREHEPMDDPNKLCGQCHGNLRFADTDHLSYNIETGTGGIGVSDLQTMTGVTCTDCHMSAGDVDGSNSAMFHGHT